MFFDSINESAYHSLYDLSNIINNWSNNLSFLHINRGSLWSHLNFLTLLLDEVKYCSTEWLAGWLAGWLADCWLAGWLAD